MTSASPPAPTQPSDQRIFTRDFVLLFVANFIVVAVYFLLMTTMAYYAVQAFACADSVAGLVASIFLVGGVLGRILSGRYAQYVGLKKIAVVALFVQLAMCVLYFFDGLGVGFLLAVRLIHGLSFGITNTVLPAMAVEALPRDRVGEGTGYFMLSSSLGTGIGPIMGLVVTAGIEYRVLFVICTALTVVAIASALVAHHARAERPAKPGRFTWGSVLDLSTAKFSVFMFLVALSYSSLNSFLNSYAISMDMGMYAPLTFVVYSVMLVLTRPLTGKIMDRHGENAVLYPSIVSMAIGLMLAAVASNPAMLLSCGIFMALGFGTSMSVGQAAATRMTKSGNTTLAISTFFLLCDGGCGVGPFFWGLVVSAAGYRAMYVMCACVALVGVVYYHLAHGRKAKALREQRALEAVRAAGEPQVIGEAGADGLADAVDESGKCR